MTTPTRNFYVTLTTLLWSAVFLVQPLTGLAETTNQVLSLDGSGDYVSVPSASDLQNPTEITVEAWIYPQQGSQNTDLFINKSDNVNSFSSRSYELGWVANADGGGPGNDVRFVVFLNNGYWTFVHALAPSNTWVHVAGCFSSSRGVVQLFTNGVLADTTTEANGTPLTGTLLRQTTMPVRFGRGDYSPYFYAHGYMDEARIWNKARTQAEIASRRFCRLSGSETNLAGYWNFDDGTANDLTTNGHNGTFFGDAQAVPIVGNDAVHAGVCGETTILIRVSQIELCWDTLTNNWYQLQYESSLTANQWVPLMANWLTGDGNRFCTNDAVTSDQVKRFYRLAVTNSPPQ